jgi:cellulose synthase/poly-beta-1,6-N-acetylglucosamine synthase-like glycosyltransferase
MKTMESFFGYVTVLPGAFSCYNWAALKASNYHVLKEYFKRFSNPVEVLSDWRTLTVMSLAEDRFKGE